MNIVDRDIKSIRPYERNPRMNEASIPKVAASIREFGFKVPIIIDRDGVIVAGHTRYQAAQELGLQTVPCIVADDLTDEQIEQLFDEVRAENRMDIPECSYKKRKNDGKNERTVF